MVTNCSFCKKKLEKPKIKQKGKTNRCLACVKKYHLDYSRRQQKFRVLIG